MNQEIIDKRWKISRKELKQFLRWYKKQNKKTQDKIQEIINYYDISYNDLNKGIKQSDKDRLNRKIEEWKKQGIYKGYFKYFVESLNKYSIKYRELIEILLYGAFMEELGSVNSEINNLFKEISQDCYNQGRNDLGKNEKTIPHSFLDNFSCTLLDGIILADYLDALYLTNSQEIYKQYLISSQQNKKLDTYSDLIQRQFEKQRNRLICINDDKYSGGLDKYTTALGNMAYLEASSGYNADVKFISDHCEHVTEMCSYMDGMIFNTEKRNVFNRPYGDSVKDLALQEMDIMGLVLGVNMPPITKHQHWCHSTITYLVDRSADELRKISLKNIKYKVVTTKWLNDADLTYKEIGNATSVEKNGKNYFVNKTNKIEFLNREKENAEWLVNQFGGKIEFLPTIQEDGGISCSDYKYYPKKANKKWYFLEEKETNGKGINVFYHALEDKEEQSNIFLIDCTNSNLTNNEIYERIERVFISKKTQYVKTIIVKNNKDLFGVFQSK